MKKSFHLACLLTFAASIGASASVYTWRTDIAEGAWTDLGNWLADGGAATAVPGASDSVQFAAGEKAVIVLDDSVFEGPDQGAPFHFQQSSVEFRGTHPRLVGFIGACVNAQFIFALPLTPYEKAPVSISKAIGTHCLSPDAGEKAIALEIPRDCPARKERKFGAYPIIDWAKKTGYGIVTASLDLNPAAGKLFVGDRFDSGFSVGYDTGDDALPTDLTFLPCPAIREQHF